jgi:signal transduction histidine kinase
VKLKGAVLEVTRRDRPHRRITPAMVAVAVVSAAAAFVGLLVSVPGTIMVPWFIPVADVATIVCVVVTSGLAIIDARLRNDTRSLPLATLGLTLAILWTAHLLVFPGDVPIISGPEANDTTSWLYLIVNLVTPSMLALTALRAPRAVADGGRAAWRAVGIGLGLGLVLVALGVTLGCSSLDTLQGDRFGVLGAIVGVVGLVPAALALALILRGHWSDERVLDGVVGALVLSAMNSVLLLWLRSRYTPIWYAVHVLPIGIAASLLLGELSLYARSVRAELRAVSRLQASFAIAEAVVSSLRPDVVVDRLLEEGMTAVEADRALLSRVRGTDLVVEGGRSLDISPRRTGEIIPLDAAPYIEAAVHNQRVEQASGDIGWRGLSEADASRVAAVRHAMAVPLVFGTEVLGVLSFVRIRDQAFDRDDVTTVRTIAHIAALALRNAREFAAVEEVSRAKSLFLNMAAHELRTPLSVVRGYASMLRDGSFGPLPAQIGSTVSVLQSKSDELSHLVEDILMASRVEAGRVRPQSRLLDLRRAVEESAGRLAPSAELRCADVSLELPVGELPVNVDRDYLARILDNLLVNALTYSLGQPWIRIHVTKTADMAEVAVEDRGVGLCEHDQQRIFERFERVDHPELGFPAGTGLGLYLSRRLAEELGGSLRLDESKPGRGSRFVLSLPTA